MAARPGARAAGRDGGRETALKRTGANTTLWSRGRALSAACAALAVVLSPHAARADGHQVYLPYASNEPRLTAPVVASPPRGLYDTEQLVTLSSVTSGAAIYYTTDGTTPDPALSLRYQGPLPVAGNTILRAVAIHPRLAPSEVTTHSYFFPEQVIHQPPKPLGFPTNWGRVDERVIETDYEMDPQITEDDPRYVARVAADLKGLPTVSIVTRPEDMFFETGIYANPLERGSDWERPGSMELIYPDGRPSLEVNAGVRIAGGYSRNPDANRKHSFSIHFRGAYGPKKLSYRLFPGSHIETFDALRLRAGQADTFEYFPGKAQYVHDEWGRRTQAAMGWPAAPGMFVHLYVNGLYWGLYNLTDEIDGEFAAQSFGGDDKGYDIVEKKVDGPPAAQDGDMAAFDEMLAIDPSTPEGYAAIQKLLDVTEYADYTILELYGANRDWPENNWIAVRRRTPDGRFRFMAWDIEQMTQLWRGDAIEDRTETGGAAGLHARLITNPEYRVLFGDRLYKHLGPGGALAPDANEARYRQVADEVLPGIVPESARWGDAIPGYLSYAQNRYIWDDYWRNNGYGHPQTLDDQWLPERDRILNYFFRERTPIVFEQFRAKGLYPSVTPPTVVRQGTTLRIDAPTGKLYYTLDGSDPRMPGGDVAPTARVYKGPLVVPGYALVRARALAGAEWSALAEAEFGDPYLEITEIMYHAPTGRAEEFLELHNSLPAAVSLAGARFTDGVELTFAEGTEVPAGAYVVLAADAAAFARRYGFQPFAAYTGGLDNAGERLRLVAGNGRVLADVTYGDDGPWPVSADGLGWSLVPRVEAPSGELWHPESWRASRDVGGSPGAPDPDVAGYEVVVNEVLANSDPPFEDAIELKNQSGAAVDVGGWFLSDDRSDVDTLRKVRIADGTVLPPHGFKVIYAQDFGAAPAGFGLNGEGEEVYLAAADSSGALTGVVQGFAFGAAEPNQSIGRVDTVAGAQMARLIRPTFGVDQPATVEDFRAGVGAENAPPYVGPVVVSEVMYAPRAGGQEFVELANRTGEPVSVGADGIESSWRLSGGAAFVLPAGLTLAPGGRAVVTGGDPDAFRAAHGIPPSVPVLGPFTGHLGKEGDVLRLERPIVEASTGDVGFALEDLVVYRGDAPWPRLAAGAGPSLERRALGEFGARPGNWIAVADGGTPGAPNSVPWTVYLPLGVSTGR